MPELDRTSRIRIGPVAGVCLSGTIDERFSADSIDPAGAEFLVLDTQAVSRISSFGVREWMRAVSAVASRLPVYFVNTSQTMMDQFNMISGFDCGGTLLTFNVVCTCSTCGTETTVAIDTLLDRDLVDGLGQPERQCLVCGQATTMIDEPALAFEYSRSVPAPRLPRELHVFFANPDNPSRVPPGSRVHVGKKPDADGTTFEIRGLIDKTFPVRSIVVGAEGKIVFSLAECSGLARGGVERWLEVVEGLASAGCQVHLAAVPPPILKACADNPAMAAGCELASVALRVGDGSGRSATRQIIPIDQVDEVLRTGLAPGHAGWQFGGDPTFLQDLVIRAKRASQASRAAVCGQTPEELFRLAVAQDDVIGRQIQIAPLSGDLAGRFDPGPFGHQSLAEGPGGTYEILCRVARGGMAELFLARYCSTVGFRRLVLIKRLHVELLTDERTVRMFLDEARLAARLNHPNIVSVLDLGKADGGYFIAMEWVHGRNLLDIATRCAGDGQRIPPDLALTVLADVCSALDRAHAPDGSGRRLVHGDVTPRNIVLSFDGVTKLVDFGLARLCGEGSTAANVIPGTPAFIAPECFSGEPTSPGSDIWAVGVTAYFLLTGRYPFPGTTPTAIMAAVLSEDPPPVTRLASDLPPGCDALVHRALSKDPAMRHASASALEADLRQSLAELKREVQRQAIGEFLRNLFSSQVAAEAAFVGRTARAGLTEALLFAAPTDVANLFLTLGSDVIGEGMDVTRSTAGTSDTSVGAADG